MQWSINSYQSDGLVKNAPEVVEIIGLLRPHREVNCVESPVDGGRVVFVRLRKS